jgi:hypothetical protein
MINTQEGEKFDEASESMRRFDIEVLTIGARL